MNFKLFREHSEGGSSVFIANLRNVDIARASWKPGANNTRIAVPGLMTAASDVDLTDELVTDQAYYLAGADGDRFDFELSGLGKALSKSGNIFKIAIL